MIMYYWLKLNIWFKNQITTKPFTTFIWAMVIFCIVLTVFESSSGYYHGMK